MNLFFEDGDRVQCWQGDCLAVMPRLEGQFDMILADLPYQKIQCSWDQSIPFEPLWENYKRLIKPNGAIVLFGSQPFTTDLICSNREWFKYELIWEKNQPGGFLNAKYEPLRSHENILVFYLERPTYNPQFEEYSETTQNRHKDGGIVKSSYRADQQVYNEIVKTEYRVNYQRGRYPGSVHKFNCVHNGNFKRQHPTQKPIEMLGFLIRMFSNLGDRILDNTAGSFSTGVAAVLNGRKFVGIERESKYCEIGQQRLEKALQEVDSMLIKPWEVEAPNDDTPVQPSLFAS